MTTESRNYTSGNWMVRAGEEDQFIDAWTDFTKWAAGEAPGAHRFVLIRDEANARHFVSFGAWADKESVDGWRSSPTFAEYLGRCRSLCEEFVPGDYIVAAEVTA